MLQRNMRVPPPSTQDLSKAPALWLELDDVLGSLLHARRTDDLGRLAALAYWDVRRWARMAHKNALAELASDLVTQQPHPSRTAFLALVDAVIQELERIRNDAH